MTAQLLAYQEPVGGNAQTGVMVKATPAALFCAGRQGISIASDAYEAPEGADALAIVTERQEFLLSYLQSHQGNTAPSGDIRRLQLVQPGTDDQARVQLLRSGLPPGLTFRGAAGYTSRPCATRLWRMGANVNCPSRSRSRPSHLDRFV